MWEQVEILLQSYNYGPRAHKHDCLLFSLHQEMKNSVSEHFMVYASNSVVNFNGTSRLFFQGRTVFRVSLWSMEVELHALLWRTPKLLTGRFFAAFVRWPNDIPLHWTRPYWHAIIVASLAKLQTAIIVTQINHVHDTKGCIFTSPWSLQSLKNLFKPLFHVLAFAY